ncbi:Uncharacterised protein [Elizabethkingia anophelis]|nr:Uncharacterised protein [Elizabethkingia anophelis]
MFFSSKENKENKLSSFICYLFVKTGNSWRAGVPRSFFIYATIMKNDMFLSFLTWYICYKFIIISRILI